MRYPGRPDEPAYAGGATFSKIPLVLDPAELAGHDVAIVGHGDAPIVPADAARSHEAIRSTVRDVAEAGLIPIVLGGDHSIAHPDAGAVAATTAPEPVGLVHFDAHADDAA